MTEQPVAIHPSVAAYLERLSRLLVDLDPSERAEVIDGVREHIESRLANTAHTDADVRAALTAVGPAQEVADEAYGGRPRPAPSPARPAVTSRAWMPGLVAVIEAVTVLVVVAVAGTAGGVSSSSATSGSVAGGSTTAVTTSHFDGSVGAGIVAFFAALPFWVVLAVLVVLSSLWLGREKVALLAVAPLSALSFAALPELGYRVVGIDGVYIGAWVAIALSLLGGGAVVAVLTRRAHRRATAETG